MKGKRKGRQVPTIRVEDRPKLDVPVAHASDDGGDGPGETGPITETSILAVPGTRMLAEPPTEGFLQEVSLRP